MVEEQTCDTLAVETIPLCMVKEVTAAKEDCMETVCTPHHLFLTDVLFPQVDQVRMKACKCQEFRKIREDSPWSWCAQQKEGTRGH